MNTVNKVDVCNEFIDRINEIDLYIRRCKDVFVSPSDSKYLEYSYENGIIMLYKAFEYFIMRTIIACLNHDHAFFEKKNKVRFGKHINIDVCEFLLTNGGYFDFAGRDGMSKVLAQTIGKEHNIAKVFKKNDYKDTIIQLCALRNYAAHNSNQSKSAAMKSLALSNRIATPGKCLQQNRRFQKIMEGLRLLANDVKDTPMFGG